MSAARRMLETYPRDLGRIDIAKLVACIDACLNATKPAQRVQTPASVKTTSIT